MSVTSGFFNALNEDRKYNAEQMSAIFDGVINDGIFANVGNTFNVTVPTGSTGFQVNVDTGRAWFNSKWIYNDTILPLTLDQPEVLLSRIDAIVIEINTSEEVRAGSIKIVKGTPASTPQNPSMTNTTQVHQYPLAYILVEPNATSLTQSKITSRIGTSDCPYITGILQVQNIDNIVAQWGAQWIEWFTAEQELSESEREAIVNQWTSWFTSTSGYWDTWFTETTEENETELATWMAQMKSDFLLWFQSLEDMLEPDVAANLANRILELEASLGTLEKNKTIYGVLLDSTGSAILDSAGLEIEGKTMFLADNNVVADNIGYSNDASGLNAHTVQGALDELAARKPAVVYHVKALASDWSNGTNAVHVAGINEDNTLLIGVDDIATDEEWTAASNALLRGIDQDIDTVVLKALGAIPLVDIPILIYAWPKAKEG